MRGFPRGPQAHPGLRGKVEAGFQLSAWGRACWESHCLSPSSASYVPEDLCERGGVWGRGHKQPFQKGGETTCLWERRLRGGGQHQLTLGSEERRVLVGGGVVVSAGSWAFCSSFFVHAPLHANLISVGSWLWLGKPAAEFCLVSCVDIGGGYSQSRILQSRPGSVLLLQS